MTRRLALIILWAALIGSAVSIAISDTESPTAAYSATPAPTPATIAAQAPTQSAQPPQLIPQEPVVQYVPTPTYHHDSGVGSLATGMMLGHMMSGGSSRSNVTNHTTVVKKYYSRPSRKSVSKGYSRRR